MNKGFMQLTRNIDSWGWYRDSNTFRVFFHLLLKANWKESTYMGNKIERGSLVTGRKQLAVELDISEQNVRTALSHLQSTNEITIKSTNKFSIVTICEYDSWVGVENQTNQQDNQQSANNQPTNNQQLTTIEELIKENKLLKEELAKASKKKVSPVFVPPTIEEVDAYIKEQGYHFDASAFIDFYESKGWYVGKNKMKEWKAACRTWEKNRKNDFQRGIQPRDMFSENTEENNTINWQT